MGNILLMYVKWSDYKAHKKYRIWEMLNKIGDEVVIVFGHGGNTSKSGISKSMGAYSNDSGKVLKIVYRSSHLVKVRFDSCV